jgi:hypothetical protein
MTTKHEVIAAHRKHPEWTAGEIASALGCMREYVVSTARRNDLTLPKVRPAYTRPYVYLTASARQALSIAAQRRGVTVAELAREIIDTVARDHMVDAVLDDRVAA